MLFHVHARDDERIDVRLTDHDHHDQHPKRRRRLLGHVAPVDTLLPRILELVHQRRQRDISREVAEIEVVRVKILALGRAFPSQLFVQPVDFGSDDSAEAVDLVVVERRVGFHGEGNIGEVRVLSSRLRGGFRMHRVPTAVDDVHIVLIEVRGRECG